MPVGRIVGTRGLKGEMKVEVLTDFLERMDVGRRLRLDGRWVTVENARIHNDRLLLCLSGVNTIEEAEALYRKVLEAPTDERPELEEDEFVTADLIGLNVQTTDGENLGKVDDVLLMPAHDVLQVGEILIPMVKQFVKRVSLEEKLIEVQLIEGMRGEEE